MSEPTTVERVAEALKRLPVRDSTEPGGELDNLRLREAARAAIEAMRTLSIGAQMAGCEAQSTKSIEFGGPLKKPDDCKTPEDWVQRGFGFAKRMMSGEEFMAGWNGAIDAALREPKE